MRLTLILNEAETEALRKVAAHEDRPPRDQVRRLVRESLCAAGALDDTRATDRPDPKLTTAAARSRE